MSWMDDAACKGKTELFFSAPRERPAQKMLRELAAKMLCDGCPVRVPCKFAGEHEFGIWGGMNEEERGITMATVTGAYSVPEATGVSSNKSAWGSGTAEGEEVEPDPYTDNDKSFFGAENVRLAKIVNYTFA